MIAHWRILVSTFVLMVSGCAAKTPDGRFACRTDKDCPAKQQCYEQLCYRNPPRDQLEEQPEVADPVSAPLDLPDAELLAESADAELPTSEDATAPDAAVAASRAPLRVLHASLRSAALSVEIGGERAVELSYGAVTEPSHGEPRSALVRVRNAAKTLLFELTVKLTEPAVLVVMDRPEGLTTRLLELPALSGEAGKGAVNYLNTVEPPNVGTDTPKISIRGADDLEMALLDRPDLEQGELYQTTDVAGAIRQLYVAQNTTLLAGFSDLPETARSAFVLMGDPKRPLIDPRGPRLFALDAMSARFIVADPMVSFLNAATPSGYAQKFASGEVNVPPQHGCFANKWIVYPLELGFLAGVPVPSQPLPVRARGEDIFHLLQPGDEKAEVCDPANQSVQFKALNLSKGRRYLMVVGDAPDTPTFTLIPEGQRETVTDPLNQMITVANAGYHIPDTMGRARFTFDRWGLVELGYQASEWKERSPAHTPFGLTLIYQSCWPTLPCKQITNTISLPAITSPSAFVVAVDPLFWTNPASMRVLIVQAYDGIPWTTIAQVN